MANLAYMTTKQLRKSNLDAELFMEKNPIALADPLVFDPTLNGKYIASPCMKLISEFIFFTSFNESKDNSNPTFKFAFDVCKSTPVPHSISKTDEVFFCDNKLPI